MNEHEQRLRRAAQILDGLTPDEQAAWRDQLDALARDDYRAAKAAADRITALVDEADRAGRFSNAHNLALLSLVRDFALSQAG